MLNVCTLVGRLTKQPELRYSPQGVAICTFTLALDRPVRSGAEKETDFIPIVTFKQTAEACANYLDKGKLAAVVGRLQVRSYDTDNGKRYVTEVLANEVKFLEPKSKGEPAADPFKGDGKPLEMDDESLPF